MAVRKKITYTVTPLRKDPANGKNGKPPATADNAKTPFERANALYGQARYSEALVEYDRALELAPQHVAALVNRGTTLARLDRFAESLLCYEQAAALDPANVDILYKRAGTLHALNRFDEAIAAYGRVLDLAPDHAIARNRRGVCQLLAGRFTSGWRDYEARWQEWRDKRAAEGGPRKKLMDPGNFGKPLWDGQPAGNRTLLVWGEQGLGDQILFASMLGEAAARVGKVILAIEARLHPLFARAFPDFEIATFADAVKRGGYDLQIPLGSLGHLFRNSADDFLRNRKAYLKADAQRIAALRKTIGKGKQRVCGLSWLSKNEDTGAMKSLSLETLIPLLTIPGLRFVDLQYGDTADERAAFRKSTGVEIAHLDDIDNVQDIDGLAALIAACDFVVTISNTTAHLAGALGKRVLLMLPHARGRLWYWQTDRHDTLWYPEVRAFRQPTPGDWGAVVNEVCQRINTPERDSARMLGESLKYVQRREFFPATKLLLGLIDNNPKDVEALQLLGVIALLRNEPLEAVRILENALSVRPDHAVAQSNLGLALSRLDRHEEALARYDRACALNPQFADAHANRGATLNALLRFTEAVDACDRAIALNPRHVDAHSNRGVALNHLNRHAEAIASHDRALALQPDNAGAHWNQCLVRLLTGDFSGGWQQWPWRWKKRALAFRSGNDQPFWYGGRRRGKTDLPHGVPCTFDPPFWDGTPNNDSLLVWPEQGVGEQVLYASMLIEARARTGKLTLILDEKMHALFARSFPDCRMVSVETALAENNFDWQIPLGDLGRFLRPSTGEFLKNRKAYLKADPARSAALRKEIAPGSKRVCGLSWFSRNAEFGSQKNLDLELLRPLLAMPDLHFVDLQYGDTAAARDTVFRETGVEIRHVTSVDNWADIDGFAALVDACDIIVTISNSTAHIAGALGKTVILLLPYSQGRFWYWQTDRDDSLWYPDMRVLRQNDAGDWTAVVEQACAAVASITRTTGRNGPVPIPAGQTVKFQVSAPRKAAGTNPAANTTAILRKAAAHLQSGERSQAGDLARAILATEPQHFDALHLLGVIAGMDGDATQSVDLISKALALKSNATAYVNRGAARLVLKHYAKALADADQAIKLQPALAVAHCVRGHALTGLKRIEEAFSSYDAAVSLNPDYDEAWHHRGNACMSLGRLQNAMASFDRALALNPANFDGLGNQSMCYLLAGDFDRGWDRYEARWKALEAGFVSPPGSGLFMLTPENFGKPLWDGTPTRGKVLVWPEQGIGDQIIFASMLPDLQQRVGQIVLALEERLHPLFRRSFPDIEIITREAGRRPNDADFQIPLGGLGKHFRRSLSDCIRNRRAFLKADPARSTQLRKAIRAGNQRLCGISWSSIHPEFGNDKSIALAALQPLLSIPGIRFVDLQYGDTGAERAALKRDTGIDILHRDDPDLTRDIDGLAALIEACDVIVTISNTTAHIAGAMGKPVWLMLPQNMGRFWYWQTDREDTLWYPQVHVVRQTRSGEWADVISRVAAALTALPASATPVEPPAAAGKTRPARKKKPRNAR